MTRLDGALERLAGLETDGLARLDLDRLAGAGVATRARCAPLDAERAEADQGDLARLLQALRDALQDHADCTVRLGLAAVHRLRDRLVQLGPVHTLRHAGMTPKNSPRIVCGCDPHGRTSPRRSPHNL